MSDANLRRYRLSGWYSWHSILATALLAGLALIGATGSALGQEAGQTLTGDGLAPDGSIVPVHDEPHHRQLFQYGPTRILELQVPPNDQSWFHIHEWPVLYMTLSQSRTQTQVFGDDGSAGGRGTAAPAARQGGPARGGGPAPAAGGRGPAPTARSGGPGPAGRGAGPAAPGDPPAQPRAPRTFGTTSYIENPVTHRIANVGDQLFHAMVVINETQGDASTSSADAGFDGEAEYENDWFRSYRIRLETGAATESHEHHTPVVIFLGTEGKAFANGPMNFEFNKPGQWAFYDAGTEHEIRNLGDGPIELMEIEVRLE